MKIILFVLLSLSIYSCATSSKYTNDFKSVKSKIDTLVFYNNIKVVSDNNLNGQIDTFLTRSNKDLINSTVMKLLKGKYLFVDGYEAINNDSLIVVSKQVVNSNKIIKDISINSFIKGNHQNRYGMILTYIGRINPNYDAYHNYKVGMATNSKYYNPSAKPHSLMVLMIVDFKRNELIYFDKSESNNNDPRISDHIEQMTKQIMAPIYYK